MTGKRMGPQLTSSVQARNTIQKLVRSGVITGPKAEPWRQRIMQEEERSKNEPDEVGTRIGNTGSAKRNKKRA